MYLWEEEQDKHFTAPLEDGRGLGLMSEYDVQG